MILPVILCGGSGSRLWPLSRKAYPKQLLTLSSGHSMLQETLLRLKKIPNLLPPIVICHSAHRFIVAEQLVEIGMENPHIILEPCARNTGPATAIAALCADKDSHLLILPADHQLTNVDDFCDAVINANKIVASDYLVTFGIHPERPETGYGYIKKSKKIADLCGYEVEEFVEKPSLNVAKQYVASHDYYWNSGIFMFRAKTYLNELNKFSPDIIKHAQEALSKAKKDLNFSHLDHDAFSQCENISIDYAVMEKSKQVAVIPLINSGWSDLGSFQILYDTKQKDENNNVIKGDVYAENVTNSYLHAENRLLAAVGITDHIIVETADAVLVAHKNASQDVKKIVSLLESKKRTEIDYHRRVHRPWGYYEVISHSSQVQVKSIVVKPGASLSLQLHHFRSEHWVVIAGVAEVICGEKQFVLYANQSTYIPALQKHRLKNIGDDLLTIIEVQTGSYLGEDDIVRFEDNYGREVKS